MFAENFLVPFVRVEEAEQQLKIDWVIVVNLDNAGVGFLCDCKHVYRSSLNSHTLKPPVNALLNQPEPEHKIALCERYDFVVPLEVW